MSGLMNKVKDALSSDKGTHDAETANTSHNEYDHRRSTTAAGAGTQIHDSSITGHGANSHSNPAVPGAFDTSSTTTAPHSSTLANKADPRLGSGADNSQHATSRTDTIGSSTSGTHGTHGTQGTQGTHGINTVGQDTSTTGLHSSKVANQADPRVDSGLGGYGTPGTHGTHGTHGTQGTQGTHGINTVGQDTSTTGLHSSKVVNQADPRVDSGLDGYGTPGSGSATGHHSQHGGAVGKVEDIVHGGAHHTETANRLDPHVAGGHGPLEHVSTKGLGSGHGTSTGTVSGHGTTGATTAGPHTSNVANKADPRVDSDLDGKRGLGHGTSSGTAGGFGTTGATAGSHTSNVAGPHTSNVANKADPRVDSDLDGKRGLGHGTSSGTTGGYGTTGATTAGPHTSNTAGPHTSNVSGPHTSNVANKADPRIDSDLDGNRGLGHGTGVTSGTSAGVGGGHGLSTGKGHTGLDSNDSTSRTAEATSASTGPHKSSMLNKLDPRVDSNQNGSHLK